MERKKKKEKIIEYYLPTSIATNSIFHTKNEAQYICNEVARIPR